MTPFVRSWRMRLLGAVLLVGAVFAAYGNVLHAPFVLDDADSITANPTIRNWRSAFFPPSGSGITVSGRPVLNASLALNYAFSGENVRGYHVTNIVLHALAGLVLWGVVRRTLLLPALAPRFGNHATSLSWLAALCWTLHPLQTESVTYVIQRAESLAGLFYLLTLYGFIRHVVTPSRCWSVLAVAACWLGMGTKEIMVSAPLVVFVYDRIFFSGSFREAWRRRHGFYATLAASWLLLGVLVVSTAGRGGSVGFSDVTWTEYALTQTTVIVRYLRLSVWPQGQVFDYGAFVQRSPGLIVASSLLLIALAAGGARSLWRGGAVGLLGLWFFAILAPSSSVIPVISQTVAEHRMYLPLAAVVLAVLLPAHRALRRVHPQAWLILFILPVAAGFTTYRRNAVYQDTLTLWTETNRAWPGNVRVLNALGIAQSEAGKLSEAASSFGEAIRIEPEYADALSNLGVVLVKLRRNDEGLALLRKAIALNPHHPDILANYGNALLQLSDLPAAIEVYEKALTLGSRNIRLRQNLGLALDTLGRYADAEPHFLEVLRAQPDNVEVRCSYARLLRSLNRIPEATAQLELALRSDPQSAKAHVFLGSLQMTQGRTGEGLMHLREAVRLASHSAQNHFLLADALAQNGQLQEAAEHYQQVLRLAPPTALVWNSLGLVYARLVQPAEAREAFLEALKLDPRDEAARKNLARLEALLR